MAQPLAHPNDSQLQNYLYVPNYYCNLANYYLRVIVYIMLIPAVVRLIYAYCNEYRGLVEEIFLEILVVIVELFLILHIRVIQGESYTEERGYSYGIMISMITGFIPILLSVISLLPLLEGPKGKGYATLLGLGIPNLAVFLFWILEMNVFCHPFRPFHAPTDIVYRGNKIRGNEITIYRSTAYEIIIRNRTDKTIDLSGALLEKYADWNFAWTCNLPAGTVLLPFEYLQIVPWKATDEELCRIGLRSDMKHLHLPRNPSFLHHILATHTNLIFDGKISELIEYYADLEK